MDRSAIELGGKSDLKDMGDVRLYTGCHIARDRKARELKLDQHLYVQFIAKGFVMRRQA